MHKRKFPSALLSLFTIAITSIMAHATGFLTLESSPSGAEVWYTGPDDPDKKFLGDTPLDNREMPTGHYKIWLILPSHDTLFIPEISIIEGQVTQMNREIPTHYGYLEVSTEPDSAEIQLDGVKIGPSPYVNNLVLPGVSRLKIIPREAYFKATALNLTMGKADSSKNIVISPYRDKSFFYEGLSLPARRFQIETGLEFRSITSVYDSAGGTIPFQTDSIPTQWDYPVGVRMGLPEGFELHIALPFKSHSDSIATFQSNMRLGVKYTYRPLNVGLDISYGLGFKNSTEGFSHDYLGLTLLAMAAKDKIVGQAQAGFEFHFPEKGNNKFKAGDRAQVHAQVGYLLDPFLPYLGITGQFNLANKYDGKTLANSSGYALIPEPGLIIDVADLLSLQFGVPFTIVGKNDSNYWGMHLSLTLGFGL